MTREEIHEYCLTLDGTVCDYKEEWESFLFLLDKKFYVMMNDKGVSLKCDPERSIELRAAFPDTVKPGYYLNKTHWNTMLLDGVLDEKLIKELIKHSYDLVFAKLTKKVQKEIADTAKIKKEE